MQESLVLTFIGPDRPGLVELLAKSVSDHGGNWLESRMSHLAGQFAGILRVTVPSDRSEPLRVALNSLQSEGLRVVIEGSQQGQAATATEKEHAFRLELVGTDRPGIVRDLSRALAQRGVNVDELHTECSNAPMSSEPLFRAKANLRLPASLSIPDLRSHLEEISNDLIVDIEFAED